MSNSGDPAEAAALHARRASSFGQQASVYAEHRPDYPAAGIRWALEPVADRDGLVVLDLGAGTGKLTEGLLAQGARPIAVEPDNAMRAELERRHPAVTALAGVAEEIPLADGSVDAVLAGQAFHWFDRDLAFPEIARVLRPGGVFAALWNTDDLRVPWVAGLAKVARSSASFVAPVRAPATPTTDPRFGPFERAEFAHAQQRTADSLIRTIGTHSHTVVIGPDARATLLGRMREYLRNTQETAEGSFELPLRTKVIRAVLRPDGTGA